MYAYSLSHPTAGDAHRVAYRYQIGERVGVTDPDQPERTLYTALLTITSRYIGPDSEAPTMVATDGERIKALFDHPDTVQRIIPFTGYRTDNQIGDTPVEPESGISSTVENSLHNYILLRAYDKISHSGTPETNRFYYFVSGVFYAYMDGFEG